MNLNDFFASIIALKKRYEVSNLSYRALRIEVLKQIMLAFYDEGSIPYAISVRNKAEVGLLVDVTKSVFSDLSIAAELLDSDPDAGHEHQSYVLFKVNWK